MLLKEMQVIKASDKNNNNLASSNQNSTASLKSVAISAQNRYALASPSSSPNVSSSLSSANLHSFLNGTNKCMSGSSSLISSSGSNTITNNSPAGNVHSYLSDLSNTKQRFGNSRLVPAPHESNHGLNHSMSNAENEDNLTDGGDLVLNEASAATATLADMLHNEDLMDQEDENEGFKVKKSKKNSTSSIESSSKNIKTSSPSGGFKQQQKQPVSPSVVRQVSPVSRQYTNGGQENRVGSVVINAAALREKTNAYVRKYACDPDFGYVDFESTDQSLKLEYYPWENLGYITAFSILPEMSELLDKNFKIATKMTYNT
jgi:hypothetical protein